MSITSRLRTLTFNRVVEAAIKNGVAKSPDDAARQLLNLLKANETNAQMGDTDGKTNVQAKAETSMDAPGPMGRRQRCLAPTGIQRERCHDGKDGR